MATRAMKLFASKACPYCHRAEIAAKEKGIAYEYVPIVLGDMPDWYKKINPNETVPTLQVDGSKLVFESNLIAQYFDGVGSNAAGSLMGSTPYQRHRIEFFLSQMSDLIGACYAVLRDPFNAEKRKFLDDNCVYIDNIVAENQTTGPYYFDNTFTMADVAVLPFLIRFKHSLMYYTGYDLFARAPHLKALWAAGKNRPSVRDTSITAAEYVKFYSAFVPESAPMAGAKGGYVLYGNKYCPFVDRARLACAAKKFTPFWVDIELPNQPEWYQNINSRETVPTLVTPSGEPVHESQLIVHYVDAAFPGERKLVPVGNADDEYAVNYFTTVAGHFTSAMYGLAYNSEDKEAKEELVWAAGQVEKALKESPFNEGKGPFHGGNQMNAGDIALLPLLVRARAYTPEMTNGYDVFADFQLLAKLLEAGLASEEAKGIFVDPKEYLERSKVKAKAKK